MSLITPDFGLIFWMVIIFGAVFFLLAKFGFPIITNMVGERTDHIAGSLKAADEARTALASLGEQQKQVLEETRKQQAEILAEAVKSREGIIAGAKDQAQVEADKLLAEARSRIDAEREDALKDIRSQVALLSVDVAEKIVRDRLSDVKEQSALLDRLVEEASAAQIS